MTEKTFRVKPEDDFESAEYRKSEAYDFFMKEGYKNLFPFEYKEYADIEKQSLTELGLWNEQYQEKYDMIIKEAKDYE